MITAFAAEAFAAREFIPLFGAPSTSTLSVSAVATYIGNASISVVATVTNLPSGHTASYAWTRNGTPISQTVASFTGTGLLPGTYTYVCAVTDTTASPQTSATSTPSSATVPSTSGPGMPLPPSSTADFLGHINLGAVDSGVVSIPLLVRVAGTLSTITSITSVVGYINGVEVPWVQSTLTPQAGGTTGQYTLAVDLTGNTPAPEAGDTMDVYVEVTAGGYTAGQMYHTSLGAGGGSEVVVNVLPGYVGATSGVVTTALPHAWQNSLYSVTFPVIDGEGNPVTLTGLPLVMDFWQPQNPETVVIVAATIGAAHGTITVADGNQLTVTLDATATAIAGLYNWLLRESGNVAPPFCNGKLTIAAAPIIQ